jgi:hypothetical protein
MRWIGRARARTGVTRMMKSFKIWSDNHYTTQPWFLWKFDFYKVNIVVSETLAGGLTFHSFCAARQSLVEWGKTSHY